MDRTALVMKQTRDRSVANSIDFSKNRDLGTLGSVIKNQGVRRSEQQIQMDRTVIKDKPSNLNNSPYGQNRVTGAILEETMDYAD